jgi:cold shock CspA family protein
MSRQPGIENPQMRTNGKITHWDADRGYGFITPSSGAKQVFVHARAFRNRNRPPEVNQLVTFELQPTAGPSVRRGCKRAGKCFSRNPAAQACAKVNPAVAASVRSWEGG